MYLRIAERPGEVRVYFQQHQGAPIDQISLVDGADGEGEISMYIHGRNGCHYNRPSPLIVQPLERFPQDGGGALRYGADQLFLLGVAKSCVKKPSAVIHDALHVGVFHDIVILEGEAGIQRGAFHAGLLQVLQLRKDCLGFSRGLCGKHVVTVLD